MSEQTHGRRREDDPGNEVPASPGQSSTERSEDGFDDVLDEIDSVLERNAEEFVRSFVQKGGQ